MFNKTLFIHKIEVRSESFWLVTERRHYNARPTVSMRAAVMWGQFYLSSSSVVSRTFSARARAMRVFDVRASSSP